MVPPASLVLAALAAVVTGATAPPARGDDAVGRIDAFVAAEMQRSRIPGVALAVVKDGSILTARGYGLANVEHKVPVRRDTVFQSGSVAKPFVATALLQLVDEGRLSLDAPIDTFFTPAPEAWKRITVRHLLSHTSGLHDYPDDFDLRHDYTEDELLAIIKAAPLAFAPGTRFLYSNLGYVALGLLIHEVTGRFYGDVLVERVFAPLGMKTARVISEADIVPNRAGGYQRLVGGVLKNQEWVAPPVNTTADGSLYLTLDDLLKWDAALAEGRPLGRKGLERAWTPTRLDGGRSAAPYGLGWFTVRPRGRRVVFHGGAWQGFRVLRRALPGRRAAA